MALRTRTALFSGSLLCGLLALGSMGCRSLRPTPGAPSSDSPGSSLPSPGVAESGTSEVGASTLGTGDVLEVRVFQEADLSGAYRVSPEGLIDFPLCGKVKLYGKTSSEAADVLTSCLSNGYLKRPQVSVLVREYSSKKVFVFGEVQKPGTFPFEENMSVVQAITLAGGFTKTAAKNSTNVTRLVDGQEKKLRVPVEDIGVGREKNFFLQPGDIVFVPESFF